jgi:hypothetical protein
MALLSYWQGDQVAFVPPGTVAERAVQIDGHAGLRDVLVAPEGRSLPATGDPEQLKQPRLRMASSSNPGIIWAITLVLLIVVTHAELRGVWSLVVLAFIGFSRRLKCPMSFASDTS